MAVPATIRDARPAGPEPFRQFLTGAGRPALTAGETA